MQDVSSVLLKLVEDSLSQIASERGLDPKTLPEVHLERPKREGQGDWSTNAAMKASKVLGLKPLDLAEKLTEKLKESPSVRAVETAGPGFINFFLSDSWIKSLLSQVLESQDFGRRDLGKGRTVLVEFVSANPTGPLHVGHGRGAAFGDTLGNILSYEGWKVKKEYYVNDAGLQMDNLGKSTQSRYFELLGEGPKAPFPEDGYKGDYIYGLAKEVIESHGKEFLSLPLDDSLAFFRDYSSGAILQGIKDDLARFGVVFDCWFSEKTLYTENLVKDAVQTLKERGCTYTKDGATWFKSTDMGDDKDRVLFRSNGVPTYFASDVAYHKNKYDRGSDWVIDVLGSDHHGYVARMKASIEALGRDPDYFTVPLIQFVNLLRDGVQVPMSTRSGQFVTLSDVIDEVGVDASRYYFLMRRSDSQLDFDLGLAKKNSSDNPVFYVQYANARMASIDRTLRERGIPEPTLDDLDESILTSPEEKKLSTRISKFPEELQKAAQELEPHRIVNYVHDLAGDFHSFYNAHRILDEGPSRPSRILLVKASHKVLSKGLEILGISAPDRM